ncbi:MAG TPA: Spy/CpxP family protein refolding chaperone [Ignavibacteria bacterium]|nr:Spy/CpxP family protein refolding chaperone [Ignavibacteria bacterium]
MLILFGVITVKGIAIAKNIRKFADGPEGFIIDKISEKLDLNASQKTQVERIKAQIKEKMESQKPDRESMMKEFSEEFTKSTLDKNSILDHMKKNESKKEEMKTFMIDKLVEFHAILTPEQRVKAVELMIEFKEMKDKHQPRGPGNFMK